MRFQHRRREWEEEEEEEGARALPSISGGMQKKEALNQAKGGKDEEEDYSAHEFPSTNGEGRVGSSSWRIPGAKRVKPTFCHSGRHVSPLKKGKNIIRKNHSLITFSLFLSSSDVFSFFLCVLRTCVAYDTFLLCTHFYASYDGGD